MIKEAKQTVMKNLIKILYRVNAAIENALFKYFGLEIDHDATSVFYISKLRRKLQKNTDEIQTVVKHLFEFLMEYILMVNKVPHWLLKRVLENVYVNRF